MMVLKMEVEGSLRVLRERLELPAEERGKGAAAAEKGSRRQRRENRSAWALQQGEGRQSQPHRP